MHIHMHTQAKAFLLLNVCLFSVSCFIDHQICTQSQLAHAADVRIPSPSTPDFADPTASDAVAAALRSAVAGAASVQSIKKVEVNLKEAGGGSRAAKPPKV